MSPLPVRLETNAILLPSGEYSGRDSEAACDTRSRASPPAAGTVHMSPADAKAISRPSGEIVGSDRTGRVSTAREGVAAVDARTVSSVAPTKAMREFIVLGVMSVNVRRRESAAAVDRRTSTAADPLV